MSMDVYSSMGMDVGSSVGMEASVIQAVTWDCTVVELTVVKLGVGKPWRQTAARNELQCRARNLHFNPVMHMQRKVAVFMNGVPV